MLHRSTFLRSFPLLRGSSEGLSRSCRNRPTLPEYDFKKLGGIRREWQRRVIFNFSRGWTKTGLGLHLPNVSNHEHAEEAPKRQHSAEQTRQSFSPPLQRRQPESYALCLIQKLFYPGNLSTQPLTTEKPI